MLLPQMIDTASETYKQRIRRYKRRETMSIWVGAGLAGLIALLAGDVLEGALSNAPGWITSLIITAIVLSGLALGGARVEFEWKVTDALRRFTAKQIKLNVNVPTNERWPRLAEFLWKTALILMALAGVLILMGIWWRPTGRAVSFLTEAACKLCQ